jgi:S1-C subfamily serine protease
VALIPPSFLDCVVAIGFPNQQGVRYAATGFLYGRFEEPSEEGADGTYRVFLVTNRHVLQGQTAAILRFNPGPGETAREFPADLKLGGTDLWVGHPDGAVDVGVLLLNVQLLVQENIPISLFGDDKHVLFHSDADAQRLTEGDGVFIIGFPMGQIGNERNYAIVRGGCLARIRDSLAGHASSFLVDSFIFPGNSGGPVIIKPEVVSIGGTQPLGIAKLIGIVSSYIPYQDVAVSQQTQRPRIIFEENSGLAQVIPVDRVREAVEHAVKVIRERERTSETGG